MMCPRNMKIATMPWRHVISLNETNDRSGNFTGGFEAEFVDILSHYLDFDYKLITPADREWGMQKDDNHWSGLVGMVQRGEADIAISGVTITEERFEVIDFIPYRAEVTTFATSVPERLPNVFFYMQTFQYTAWLGIIITFFILPLMFSLFAKTESYATTIFKIYGSFMKQEMSFKISNNKFNIIFGTWLMYALFITLAYGGVLLSFMTVPIRAKGIETIEQLYHAASHGKYTCYAYGGSSDLEFLKSSDNFFLQSLGGLIEKNNWLFIDHTDKEIKPNMAIIGYRTLLQIDEAARVGIEKHIFEEDIALWYAGIAIRKGYSCTEAIKTIVNRMLNAGIFIKLYNTEILKTRLESHTSLRFAGSSVKALTIRDFSGTFLLLGLGYILSAAGLLFECIKFKFEMKFQKQNSFKNIFSYVF